MAAVVTAAAVLVLPWWPDGLSDSTLLGFRAALLRDHDMSGSYAGTNNAIPLAYYRFGYLIQVIAAIVAPAVLNNRGEWHWLTLGVAFTTVWQFIAVVPFGLLHVTIVPFLPMLAGLTAIICWATARAQHRARPTVDQH
ncbi:hypothetical protein [Actinokineospora enzanensis]|uniref:hypothetical protein n=1 Tax=Actinokineospora enzanensis TaxID=155975 RepID=UPI0012EC2DEA|nr:hypothetical protein [Actinokineospora enzanensis]